MTKSDVQYHYRFKIDYKNSKALFCEADTAKEKEFKVITSFVVTRSEVRSGVDAKKAKPISEADRVRLAHYLQPNKHVIIDGDIRKLAVQIVGDEQNPVLAARKLYDWLLENVEYWVKDPKNKKASPVGSTTYCLTSRTGNCTDFESLWTSFARSIGIPTQIVYGSFLKPDLMGQDQDQSYHCWAEFYAPGLGWIPHDVAVADLYAGEFPGNDDNEKLVRLTTADGTYGPNPEKGNYYFGNSAGPPLLRSSQPDLYFN